MSQQSNTPSFQEAAAVRAEAHYAIHFANRELVKRNWSDPVYVATRKALDALMLELYVAKWQLGDLDGSYQCYAALTQGQTTIEQVIESFRHIIERANQIAEACRHGVVLTAPDAALETKGTETLFYKGVPIVASINPVVVLIGSNYEMGRQYAKQIIEIFGKWIFERQAARVFDDVQLAEMRKWEDQLRKYAPKTLDFARGWADGATEAGLPMSYDAALWIWTGSNAPERGARDMGFSRREKPSADASSAYLGIQGQTSNADQAATHQSMEANSMCSGACAWGEATPDGRFVAAATTDHDCSYQATVIAFPAEGNNFVLTGFSVHGSQPHLGDFFMSGHPGMNSKGVTYVHHAGTYHAEPREQWGYGIRRGAAIWHLMQFANSAREVLDYHLRLPVGDAGFSGGTASGLYADKSYGVAIEDRTGCPDQPQPILREATYDAYGKAHSFLYSNNSALDPRSGHCNSPPPGGFTFELAGGWYLKDPERLKQVKSHGPYFGSYLGILGSAGRNRYHYRTLMAGYGQIDLEYFTALYRQSGEIPSGDFKEVSARWFQGELWNSSTAHRTNAFTVVMAPAEGESGIYRGCIGPANRAVLNHNPGHGYYYYDETNAFWEITLAGTAERTLAIAEKKAAADSRAAKQALATLDAEFAGRQELNRFLDLAAKEHALGLRILQQIDATSGDERAAVIARAMRAFLRAQVRAEQVRDAINPPVTSTQVVLESRKTRVQQPSA